MEGIILTKAQIAALEKKQHDDEATGEIETAHPGYLGSQDIFYVGPLKGVGRIEARFRVFLWYHRTIYFFDKHWNRA
jgi:hypothetical protein